MLVIMFMSRLQVADVYFPDKRLLSTGLTHSIKIEKEMIRKTLFNQICLELRIWYAIISDLLLHSKHSFEIR